MIKQRWNQLLAIQTGGALCLPVIMSGMSVCQDNSLEMAAAAILVGNAFLLAMGLGMVTISVYKPYSTAELSKDYFGLSGAKCFSAVMMALMLGWFAIQLNVMVISFLEISKWMDVPLPPIAATICVGLVLTFFLGAGVSMLKRFACVSSPLLLMVLASSLWDLDTNFRQAESCSFPLGGVSVIIGANMAAVTDLPTYLRHSATVRDARICIVLLYGLIVPAIEISGVLLASTRGGGNVIEILSGGGSADLAAWTGCFVLMSGWATNNNNLYSAIASSYLLSSTMGYRTRTWLLGAGGTLIALMNPLENFETVLGVFGITTGSMGAVLLSVGRPSEKTGSFFVIASWVVGAGAGLATLAAPEGYAGVPALNAFITTYVIGLIRQGIK